MQIAAETAKFQALPGVTHSEFSVTVLQSQFSRYRVIRCNGAVVSVEPSDSPVVVTKVFPLIDGMKGASSAELQVHVIDNGTGKARGPGFQTASAASWDPFIGPIG